MTMAGSAAGEDPRRWGRDGDAVALMMRNVSTRYLSIAADGAIGLVLLPFNVAHLGQSAYGLWMLTASIVTYFSILDLGYGGALVKFVAQYRAWRDSRALNEILSTLFFVYSGVGLACLLLSVAVGANIGRLFNLTPEQAATGRLILLIIGGYVALRFALGIFGSVTYGFQRYYLNNAVSIATSVTVALVNVAMLWMGFGLVALVAATTAVRIASLAGFCLAARASFPGMRIRASLVRRARLAEVTGFSVFVLLLDWAGKLNYQADAIVIGAFMNTAAVAVWTVAQRLAELTQQLSNQVNDALFPLIVDSDAAGRTDRLAALFVLGTRLSLAMVVPVACALMMLADPLVAAWVGPQFAGSVVLIQLLAWVVLVRVGITAATNVLKGAGRHRPLASCNMATAIVNVLASIVLVRRWGLEGVAMATVVPVTVAAAFYLFPAACRRVGVTVGYAAARGVWPAAWPAAVPAAILAITRPYASGTLVGVGAQVAAACAAYAAVFVLFAVGAEERRLFWQKTSELIGWRTRPADAVA